MNKKNMQDIIKNHFLKSAEVKKACLDISADIEKVVELIIKTYKNNNKTLICGNGGSAADAQHWAAEFINKFNLDRAPLPSLALHTNTSNLTSTGNDYGFDYVFSKQIEALGNEGDVLIVITTSDFEDKPNGHSANLYQAIKKAKEKNIITIGLLSTKSEKIGEMVDYTIKVPAKETPRIQEAHITIIHIICDLVENALFAQK